MKFKKVLVATAMVGVLATGVVGYSNQADAKVYSQNGLVLHDDANFLEHELSYIDVLLDKNADQATKSYFADKGLHSIKDIINKAKQDGFDVSKYEHVK
ncbi:SPIN family peroxidase inhibitor [Staphylococcus aureus]|uniref:SPIN family peroxidase inhibitor n=1 Tax=Staphylococcus aureus TaxID=1280 RepID=UPI0010C7E255|nr:SPIN family peroxidase inhibitor [Staphylococcus aureus]